MCLSVWNNNALYWCFRSIVWIFVLIKAALLIFCCIAKKEKLFSLHQVFLWSIPIKDIPAKIELLSTILSPGYILQVLLFFETHCCHGNYWLQRTNALITFLKPLSILAKKGIQILMKKNGMTTSSRTITKGKELFITSGVMKIFVTSGPELP